MYMPYITSFIYEGKLKKKNKEKQEAVNEKERILAASTKLLLILRSTKDVDDNKY